MSHRLPLLAAIAVCYIIMTGNSAYGYKPTREIDLTLRFEGIEKLPDFDFYVKFADQSSTGKKSLHLIPVRGDNSVRLNAPTDIGLSEVFLFAAPHGQKILLPKEFDEAWVKNFPVGGLQSTPLLARADGKPIPGWPRFRVEISYRVRVNGELLEAPCIGRSHDFPWKALCVLSVSLALVVLVVAAIGYRTQKKGRCDSLPDGSAQP